MGVSEASYRTIQDLVGQAQTYSDEGYLGSALAVLREAQSLAPERSKLELDLASQIDDLELRVMRGEEARFAPDQDRAATPAIGWNSFAPEKTGPLSPAALATEAKPVAAVGKAQPSIAGGSSTPYQTAQANGHPASQAPNFNSTPRSGKCDCGRVTFTRIYRHVQRGRGSRH